jgi:hypothetical protein
MEKEILEHGFNFNRRRFLSTMSLGIGSVALGSLLMPDLLKGGGLEDEGLAPGYPAFCAQSQKGYLSFSKWCAFPAGIV